MTAFYPVIPAGGSGKRLWPLSRVSEPKFLMPVAGADENLLLQTLNRLGHVAPAGNTYVVTGEAYAKRIVEEAPAVAPENVLAEPFPMDSGPAIALAAAVIARRHPGSVMGSFAADHYIADPEPFADALRTAIRGAERDLLMTIGVEPTRPDTGYGYIQLEPTPEQDGVSGVRRFKEKPDLALATEFLKTGEYLWNASMFVWRPEVFLEELHRYDAGMHEAVTRLAAAWDTGERDQALAELWPTLTKMAIEYLVMEPAAARGRVGTVRGRFPWTDVGDFNTLGQLNHLDGRGNAILGAEPGSTRALATAGELTQASDATVVVRDSSNVVVHAAGGKLVAVIGADDLVIVDTEDVLLVCARDRVQEVKGLVDALPEISRSDLL